MNIVKNFPRAEEVRELTPVGLQSYIFEQRLKLLRKRILAAAGMGENEIKVNYVYDEVKEYLIEKGYKVIKKHENLYIISWAKEDDKIINFSCGGTIKYNTLCNSENKNTINCTNGILNEDTFNQLKEK